MSHEHEVATEVKKELRRRGFRRFVVRVGLVIGLVLGGLTGAAIPTRSTYTDALHRQAEVERYAADAILDTHTSVLSYLEGGKEAAFLRDEKIQTRTKELYRDLRRKATDLDAEAKALASGTQSLPVSILAHPGLAFRAGVDGLGRPDLMHTQVYKQAGAGALAGGLLGMVLGATAMRRRGHRR
jgi:hypothetical protein